MEVLVEMDVDADGKIDYEEFYKIMNNQFYKKYSIEDIKTVFSFFDKGIKFMFTELSFY